MVNCVNLYIHFVTYNNNISLETSDVTSDTIKGSLTSIMCLTRHLVLTFKDKYNVPDKTISTYFSRTSIMYLTRHLVLTFNDKYNVPDKTFSTYFQG